MSVADNISFANFCQLCTKVSEATAEKKINLIQNYISSWKKKAAELEKTQSNIDSSFYPVLRFLLPHLDRERSAYGVKENTLAKIYIRILSLPKDGSDATKLLEYRLPKSGSGAGDFAEVAYWVLKKRCTEGKQLSIEDVNKHLDTIAAKHASCEPHGVDLALITLLKSTSAEEQKWLIRIILKDMKLGIGNSNILKIYHPDAKDLYEASNNLQKVCNKLKDANTRLHEIEIELFSPVKPMLSEECNLEKLDGFLKRSRFFYVETKLDGERFQLHKNGDSYKYFSRNGFDFTSNFGPNQSEGMLTPKIANQFHPNVATCILDGEMISWNFLHDTFASKASNIDVKHLKNTDNHQPCFCVFDILFYNDQVLTNQPLNTRLEILEKVVKPLKGVVQLVSRSRISTKDEVLNCLNTAIDNREEGIVMKEFMSVYKPNVRKNGGWYKIKPEYIDGLSDTLDLIILGGYFGSGSHEGTISHFLVGVAVSVEEDSPMFYSVARVGSGYSANELVILQRKLKEHWRAVKAGEMPPGIEWTKEKPDVWIAPEKSFILEIKAAEITSSNLFKTGFTLRFPRVEKIRYDKSWKECLSLNEFEEKRKMASGKLASRHLTSFESPTKTHKRKTTKNKATLASQYTGIKTENIECVSDLLTGKEICVCTGFDNLTKSDIEQKIIEYGGSLVQNPGKNTYCVLAETDSNTRIKNIIKSGFYDVIKTSWFYNNLDPSRKFLPQPRPQHFLAASKSTKKILAKTYDEYGDDYKTEITIESLQELIQFPKLENPTLSPNDIFEMDVELFSGISPYSLFRNCYAYFDSLPEDSSGSLHPLELFKINFAFFGGRCCDEINNETTHVVLLSKDLTRIEEYNNINKERNLKFHLVTEEWITKSIENKALSSDYGF